MYLFWSSNSLFTYYLGISIWRQRLPEANKMSKSWVLAISIQSNGSTILERINDVIYTEYFEATNACRTAKEASQCNGKKIKCRVVELSQSVPSTSTTGRSAKDIMHMIAGNSVANVSDIRQSDWNTLMEHGNGYLSLRNCGIRNVDIPGLVQLCTDAIGSVTQLGLTDNSLGASGAVALASALLPYSPPLSVNMKQAATCTLGVCTNDEELSSTISDAPFNVADAVHQIPFNTVSSHFAHHLTAVFLSHNNVRDEGAVAIADVLSTGLLPHLVKLGKMNVHVVVHTCHSMSYV